MFYSKSTGGFYDEAAPYEAAGTWPEDAVEIPDELYDQVARNRPPGKIVVADANGLPMLADPPAPTLDELKAAKNAEINAARAAANTSTFAHAGKDFACDPLSRSDIDGVNGYVALYGALPPDFPGAWKAVDNSYIAIADVAAWKAFYAAMVATGTAHFAHAQQLKAALAAATTAADVAAIVW